MEFVLERERKIPVKFRADVVVAGGGPAGLGAALAAARNGAKTILVERYGCLGGVSPRSVLSSFFRLQLQEQPNTAEICRKSLIASPR